MRGMEVYGWGVWGDGVDRMLLQTLMSIGFLRWVVEGLGVGVMYEM